MRPSPAAGGAPVSNAQTPKPACPVTPTPQQAKDMHVHSGQITCKASCDMRSPGSGSSRSGIPCSQALDGQRAGWHSPFSQPQTTATACSCMHRVPRTQRIHCHARGLSPLIWVALLDWGWFHPMRTVHARISRHLAEDFQTPHCPDPHLAPRSESETCSWPRAWSSLGNRTLLLAICRPAGIAGHGSWGPVAGPHLPRWGQEGWGPDTVPRLPIPCMPRRGMPGRMPSRQFPNQPTCAEGVAQSGGDAAAQPRLLALPHPGTGAQWWRMTGVCGARITESRRAALLEGCLLSMGTSWSTLPPRAFKPDLQGRSRCSWRAAASCASSPATNRSSHRGLSGTM